MFNLVSIIFFLIVSISYGNSQKIVAFAQDNMGNDFRKNQVFELKNALSAEKDIKFIYSDAKGRTSMFIYQIEKFIESRVDVLVLGTNDANAIVPVVTKAHKQGIKVVVIDRGINTENYTSFLNSDNIEIGSIGAKYIVKRLNGKGSVILFEGLQTADVTHLRTKGFMDQISKYPNIKVIKVTGNYLRRDAIIEMEKLLRKGVEFDAVFSESDSMISGVRSAMYRYGKKPSSVIMIGCDYTSEAREAIRSGEQTGSIKFPLAGKEAGDVIKDIFNGKEVKKHIVIPVKLVTKENVENIEPIF